MDQLFIFEGSVQRNFTMEVNGKTVPPRAMKLLEPFADDRVD